MATKRGTTPILTITVDDMTFTGYRVFVTIQDSAGTQITKDSSDGTHVKKQIIYDDDGNPVGCNVILSLTQEETLSLEVGQAEVELTWIDVYGQVGKSEIGTFQVTRTLLESTVAYGG